MSKQVEKVFESHPKAKEVLTTSDGMPFLNGHNAKMHAKTLKDKKVTTHNRPKAVKSVVVAVDLIKNIGAATTAEAIDALIKGEKRKTVLDAATEAKAALETAAKDANNTNAGSGEHQGE